MKWLPRRASLFAQRIAGKPWLIATLILLLALVVRLLRLGAANVWWDEALAVWAVRKGFWGVTLWTAGDVHPPLYFWSLWAWVQAFGETEFAVRALSVALGVATVAAVMSLGTLVAGRSVGRIAGLLTTLARFHVWWSQETRMYVLAGLLGVLSLYLMVRWLDQLAQPDDALQTKRVRPWLGVLYVLTSAGALYTIFLMGGVLLTENMAVFLGLLTIWRSRWKHIVGRWALAQVAILALLGVWLAFSWGRMQTWSVSEPTSLRFCIELYATLLTTGVSVDIAKYLGMALFPFAVLGVGAILFMGDWWRDRETQGRQMLLAVLLVLSAAIPVAVVYVATFPRSLFYTPRVEARYFLPFAPAFWLLLAWAIERTWQWRRWIGLISAVGVAAIWLAFLPAHYSDRFLRDELQTLTRSIISQAEPGDIVLLDSGGRYPIFQYYYDAVAPTAWYPPMTKLPPGEGYLTIENVDAIMSDVVAGANGAAERIWLAEVDANLTDPEYLAASWLRSRYHETLNRDYAHNALHLFSTEEMVPHISSSYQPQYTSYSSPVRGLRGWDLPVNRFTVGDMIRIALYWDLTPAESVSVQLVRDDDGPSEALSVLARQRQETQAAGSSMRFQFDFPVYASTPAGQYRVVLASATEKNATLGTLRIAGTEQLPKPSPTFVRLDLYLGEEIVLEGYRLTDSRSRPISSVRPGDALVLDLYWRTAHKVDEDLTVFTHLLGTAFNPATGGPVWGQHDAQPANGGYPTTQWFVDETIVDRHVIQIDEVAPEGSYQLEVGIYGAMSGNRLQITRSDGGEVGDHFILPVTLHIAK